MNAQQQSAISVVRLAIILAAIAIGWALDFTFFELAMLWLLLLTITHVWEPPPASVAGGARK